MPENPKIKLPPGVRGTESAATIDFLGQCETALRRDQIITSGVLKCLVVVDTSLVMIDVIEYQNVVAPERPDTVRVFRELR